MWSGQWKAHMLLQQRRLLPDDKMFEMSKGAISETLVSGTVSLIFLAGKCCSRRKKGVGCTRRIMTRGTKLFCRQVKMPWYKRQKQQWRRQYFRKNRTSKGGAAVRRIIVVLAAAGLLYGAGEVMENPDAFLHILGIRVLQETSEKQEWEIKHRGTSWGIRFHSDGIEIYQEKND